MNKIILVVILLTILCSCQTKERSYEEIDFESDYLFSEQIEAKLASETAEWKYQTSATEYALKGDYRNALIHWDKGMKNRENPMSRNQIDSMVRAYKAVNAGEYILNAAQEYEVVIINEAHHSSLHRVFTKSLLKQLYDSGYHYLGLEALGNGEYLDSNLNSRKYPIVKSGYYTKDPQFGNLIRDALEIGFELFAYENMNRGNGRPREIEQAKNIKQFMDSRPEGKFLIHCGYDHALEGEHRSWDKAMAGRLSEYTGKNPLTINQVLYSEKSDPELDHPLLRAIEIEESSVLVKENEQPFRYERGDAWTDLAVFHPRTEYVSDRPAWLFEDDYKAFNIDLSDVPLEFPVMVMAYRKGEDISKAIPMDILEIKQAEGDFLMSLKPGEYNMVVTNGAESVKFELSLIHI